MQVEINLYFWKLALLSHDGEFKNNFRCYRDEQDTVIELGRFEFYIIPRNSISFLQ